MNKPCIICVDDELIILDSLKVQLRRFFGKEYQIETAVSAEEVFDLIEELVKANIEIPLIICDYILPGMSGTELLRKIHEEHPNIITVLLTGRADTQAVADAVNYANLYRFIGKPWEEKDMVLTIKQGLEKYDLEKQIKQQNKDLIKLLEKKNIEIDKRKKAEKDLKRSVREIAYLKERLEEENIYLKQEINVEKSFEDIIGESDPLKYVIYRIEQVADSNTTVLIQGETGTGKELVARAIHKSSSRNERPLIKVNCAAIPSELIESELFGHEKGAFTGAYERKLGRFEVAHKGTLLLDEIGELPMNMQAKLLRAIEFGEFERVGNSKPIKVDVRLIASTNRNLETEVNEGRFRKDLFYRLNVYPVTVPPLRQRKSDIASLVKIFVERNAKKLGKEIDIIPQKVLDSLHDYDWPGNVRELENVIERAVILTKNNTLHVEIPKDSSIKYEELRTLRQIEKEYILQILEKTKGKISGHDGAAQILGLHPNTLRSRMEKLGIQRK